MKIAFFLLFLIGLYTFVNKSESFKNLFKKEQVLDKSSLMKNKEIKELKESKKPEDYILSDKRINPINSVLNEKVNQVDPIKSRVPSNLERILQYELNVWSRGLDSSEIDDLRYLHKQYNSNLIFSKKEKEMLDALDSRNILNAIRASRPDLVKSKEDIQKEDDLSKEKEYQDQEKNDNYPKEDINYHQEDSYKEDDSYVRENKESYSDEDSMRNKESYDYQFESNENVEQPEQQESQEPLTQPEHVEDSYYE